MDKDTSIKKETKQEPVEETKQEPVEEPKQEPTKEEYTRAVVNCDLLNLRSKPFQKDSEKAIVLSKGTELKVKTKDIANNPDWIYVIVKDLLKGYVKFEFLSIR